MVEVLKNKTMIIFIVLVLGFAYLGGVDDTKQAKFEEINNIEIVNQ